MKAAITLEDGIPPPEGRSRVGSVVSAMRAMEIGQSFLFPKSDRNDLYPNASRAGIKVRVCNWSDTEVRCWRVA